MSKRFIDTNLFNDEWFCELTKDCKLFFLYYITQCDHAGILRLNKRLCKFQTGINDLDTVIKEFENCILTVKEGLYFMPKYIKYQYPDFPKSNVKQQDGALKILKELNLWDEENNSYLTLNKELINSYDNDNDNDNDIVINNWKTDFQIYKKECNEGYKKFFENEKLLKEQERLNPGINVRLSIEKGYKNFWIKEAGWKHKKTSRTKTIDWESTIINSISLNKVYYTKEELAKINQ